MDRVKTGTGQRTAFRIVAGLLAVIAIGSTLWFAVTAFLDDAEAIHRLHFVAGVFASGLLLGGSLVACAVRPEPMIGPFWVAVASGIANTIAGLASGDLISGAYVIAPVAMLILLALHPARARLLRIDGIDASTIALGALALLPAVAYALTQAELQRNGVASDPHVEFHHYSAMASYALTMPLAAFAASLRVPGRRVAAWIVGATGAALGISSLALSDHVGAFDATWAWLAIAWGIAVVIVVELRPHAEPS